MTNMRTCVQFSVPKQNATKSRADLGKKNKTCVCNACYIWKTIETYDLAQVKLNPVNRMHAMSK